MKEYLLFWLAQAVVGVSISVGVIALCGIGYGIVYLLAKRKTRRK